MGASPFVVYVVDEDPDVRDGLCLLMRSAGFKVRSCASGDELVDMPGISVPGCVLFGLSAAGTSSVPLADRLGERGLDLPLIALTAREGRESDREARAAGARFLMRKPVDDRALLDAIHWVVGGQTCPPDGNSTRKGNTP